MTVRRWRTPVVLVLVLLLLSAFATTAFAKPVPQSASPVRTFRQVPLPKNAVTVPGSESFAQGDARIASMKARGIHAGPLYTSCSINVWDYGHSGPYIGLDAEGDAYLYMLVDYYTNSIYCGQTYAKAKDIPTSHCHTFYVEDNFGGTDLTASLKSANECPPGTYWIQGAVVNTACSENTWLTSYNWYDNAHWENTNNVIGVEMLQILYC